MSGLGIDFGDVSDNVSPPRPQPQARAHLLKHQRSAPNLSSAASLRLGAESTQRIGGPSIITSIGISPSLMQAGFGAGSGGHGSGPQGARRGGHQAGRDGSRGGLAAAPKKAMGRTVRIASGEPGVLGHGAGHVDSTPSSFTPSTLSGGSPSDLASSSDSSPLTSVTSYSQGSASDASAQHSKERREKLAAAVAIMQKRQGGTPDTISSAASSQTGSTVMTSPNESSSGSSVAGEKKSSRKSKVLRKHTSQPNFHGSSLMQRAQTQINSLPPLPPAAVTHNMARSQSAIDSASDTDSSRSSLFRSSNVQVRRPNQPPRTGKATIDPTTLSSQSSSSAKKSEGSSVAGGSSDAGASTDRESASTQNTLTTAQLQQQIKVGGFYASSGPVNQPALDHQARLRLTQSTSDLHGSQYRMRMPRAEMMSSPDNTTSDDATSGSELGSSRERLRSKTLSNGGDAADARSSNGSSVSASRSHRPMSAGTEAIVTMRSARGMRGLEDAEHGGTMISLDQLGKGFEAGASILPEQIRSMEERDVICDSRRGSTVAGTEIGPLDSVSNVGVKKQGGPSAAMLKEPHLRMVRSMTDLSSSSSSSSLQREATLLSASAHPARRSRELNKLLGNSSKKLADANIDARALATINDMNGSITSMPDAEAVLEHDRAGKARVGLDLMLESDLIVEGGTMRGQIMLKIRKAHDKEGPVKLMQPKVRVVGFEGE